MNRRPGKREDNARTTLVVSKDALAITSRSGGVSSAVVNPTHRRKPKTIRILEEGEEDTATKQKKLRRVDFAAEQEDDDLLLGHPDAAMPLLEDVRPTALRLTEKGGYRHTKQSRMKISQANQGKSPWNKGKERTASAKAKISAGVKARNHVLLLQKLQTWNMTEDEWWAKKKQIKLLRERVRKAKIAAAKFQQEQLELKQKKEAAVSVVEEDPNTSTESTWATQPNVEWVAKPHATRSRRIPEESAPTAPEPQLPPQPLQNTIPAFSPDIQWTPHVLDTPSLKYDMLCPHGGPGGLICCHSCMVQYSKYMTSTCQDLERQATAKVGREVQELLDDMGATQQQLVQTMKVARRKPIPLRHNYTTSHATGRREKASAVERTITTEPTTMDFPDIQVKEEI
jgi:NUMOD3 motif